MNNKGFIPKQTLKVLVQEVDDEVLILDRNQNQIHQLNAMASLIWKKCNGINTVESIVKELVNDYEISYEDAEKDVVDTIHLFCDHNLLEK